MTGIKSVFTIVPMKTILTGVKPTGEIHIGNYIGAIRPALELANDRTKRSLFFIADYHALTTVHEPQELNKMTYEVAATWIALGLDTSHTILYRQSDIPELFELAWVLSCFSPKGLMNRAHAYKAIVQENQNLGKDDLDSKVTIGVYTYPILMGSDILSLDSDIVPVGEDQLQHIEIARDIAQKINHNYKKNILKIPEGYVQKNTALIPGLDGRKMSKSYDNTIPLFCDQNRLKKLIMKIKTDSTPPDQPKNPNDSLIFTLYKHFASPDQIEILSEKYKNGISWGEAKTILYDAIDAHLSEPRSKYIELMQDKAKLDKILEAGAVKARKIAREVLDRTRSAIGIS